MLGGLAPLPLRLVADALQGLSAQQHARLSADLSAAVSTVPFAVMLANFSGTTGEITSYIGQNGVGLSHAPTLTYVGTGIRDFVWSDGYKDDYGSYGATNIVKADISLNSTFEFYGLATVTDRRTVRVRGFGGSGLGASAMSFCLVVY